MNWTTRYRPVGVEGFSPHGRDNLKSNSAGRWDSLADFFSDLADSWRGWDGKKTWRPPPVRFAPGWMEHDHERCNVEPMTAPLEMVWKRLPE